MKRISKRQINHSLLRLLSFNSLLVIVITVILATVFCKVFLTEYNGQLKKLNLQTVSQFRNFFDREVLRDVIAIPNQYFTDLESDEPLSYPLLHDIRKDTTRIIQTSKRLNEIRTRFHYLDSIDIYYQKTQLLFMDTGVCLLPDSGCKLSYRVSWLGQASQPDSIIDWRAGVTGQTGNALISYIRSIPYFAPAGSRLGIISINLDVAEIQSTLGKLNFASGSSLLIMDEKGELVFGTQNPEQWGSLDRELRERIIGYPEKEGVVSFRQGSHDYMLSFSKSEMNRWRYMSILPVGVFYQKSIELRNWLIWIGVILLAVNVAASVVLTRKAYKPIGYELNQLKENLERNKPVIRHAYISMLLEGKNGLEKRQKENERIAGIVLEHPRFLCFVLHLQRVDREARQEVLLKLYALVDVLEIADPRFRIYAVQDGDDKISGFVNYAGPDNAATLIEQMMLRTAPLLANSPFALAVGIERDWSDSAISQGYQEAATALEYEFLYGRQVMRFDQLELSLRRENGPVLRYMQAFEEGLTAANEDKALQAVSQTVEHLLNGCYSIKFCKQTLAELTAMVSHKIQSLGYRPEEYFGVDLRNYEHEAGHLADFAEWFRPYVQWVIQQASQPQADLELRHRINQFIEHNLHQQISLHQVAEYLNVSESYASKFFKSVIGRSFTEHVTDLKMRRALVLLLEERLSVQDISARLGYNTTHHFIRLFKDKFGQTPKQYQKTHEGVKPPDRV